MTLVNKCLLRNKSASVSSYLVGEGGRIIVALSAKQETTPGEIKANDVTSVDFSPLTEIRPRRPLQLKKKKKRQRFYNFFVVQSANRSSHFHGTMGISEFN